MTKLKMLAVCMVSAMLGACVSDGSYTRATTGDAMQTALAECKAEGSASVADSPNYALGGGVIGVITRSNKADSITEGCMARHGYVTR